MAEKQRYYTDYPFVELGDSGGKPAPIRECFPLDWDGDKYVSIEVGDHVKVIKAGYIYTKPGRLGDVPQFDPEKFEGEYVPQ